MEDKVLDKLAQIAYEIYTDTKDAKPEDYFSLDILPYKKLSAQTKKHWKDVVCAIIASSWNLDYADLEE